MSAKLVVTPQKGGSRIALVGASGKELLTSAVFSEPRAKGATLRSLKGLLGETIVIEDHTVSAPRGKAGAKAAEPQPAVATAAPAAKPAVKPAAKTVSRRRAVASAAAAPATAKVPAKKGRRASTKR